MRSPSSPWCNSRRGTETGEAPRSQGATTENIGQHSMEEQRRERGCIAGRMPPRVAPLAAKAAWRLAGLGLVTCLLLHGDARSQTPTPPPAQAFSDTEITRAADTVRTDPNLGGTRTIRTLRWKESGSSWSLPSWIMDLIRFVAGSGRALLWGAIVVLAVLLVVYLVRALSAMSPNARDGTFVTPTHVRDLDIRPESLPPDIGAAARQLWDRGEHRAALALLYRGLLSRLAHVHKVPIRDSTTEGDCLALAAQHMDEPRQDYVTRLVRTWQRAVYGGSDPDAATVYAICDAFGSMLDQPAPRALTSLDVAEASA